MRGVLLFDVGENEDVVCSNVFPIPAPQEKPLTTQSVSHKRNHVWTFWNTVKSRYSFEQGED
jgi:hypothetical protein